MPDNHTPLYTEGVCDDGAAILRDGVMMTISDVLATLNGASDEIERLKAHLDPEAHLVHAGKPPGQKTGFEFAVSSPIVRIIANHMAAMLKAHGAENYVEMGFTHDELGPLTLVVQRDHGDTPARKAAECDAEIERLRQLVRRLTDKLEDFVREHPDPGADAFAAIHCGRNLIYG